MWVRTPRLFTALSVLPVAVLVLLEQTRGQSCEPCFPMCLELSLSLLTEDLFQANPGPGTGLRRGPGDLEVTSAFTAGVSRLKVSSCAGPADLCPTTPFLCGGFSPAAEAQCFGAFSSHSFKAVSKAIPDARTRADF